MVSDVGPSGIEHGTVPYLQHIEPWDLQALSSATWVLRALSADCLLQPIEPWDLQAVVSDVGPSGIGLPFAAHQPFRAASIGQRRGAFGH